MRTASLLLVLLFTRSSHAQILDSVTEGTIKGNAYVHHLDLELQGYADSLNLLTPERPLPGFASDVLFDYKHYWTPFQHGLGYVSYRVLILNRVTNEAALLRIIKSKDARLDSTFQPTKLLRMGINFRGRSFRNMPFQYRSFRSLAESRLDALLRSKRRFLNLK
jgi:hypothetical protein